MELTVLNSETRTADGKGGARKLRATGKLPGVVYSEGKDATPIALDTHQVKLWLSRHTGESLLVDLKVDDAEPKQVLLKEVQAHPVNDKLLHIDFYAVTAGHRIKVNVPLEFHGTPVGVSQGGGNADFLLRSIDVNTLPRDMPQEFTADIGELEIGDILTVADLNIDEKYEVLTPGDAGVVTISAPRVATEAELEAEEAAEGEGEEPAETEESED